VRIQPSPSAITASKTALPLEVPATVTSPARRPLLALVAMTRVTIGPGTRISTVVMSRNAVNRCQFIEPSCARHIEPASYRVRAAPALRGDFDKDGQDEIPTDLI
jgi:hypothetical protein